MDLIPSSEAAELLEVHPSRIRALLAENELPGQKIGGRWLVDRQAVIKRAKDSRPAGRPLSARNAWQLLFHASGQDLAGLSAKERWRLNQALRMDSLAGLGPKLFRRAVARNFDAHPGELSYLAEDPRLVKAGISAAPGVGLELVPGNEVEAYVRSSDLAAAVQRHALQVAAGPSNVRLHVVPDDAWLFKQGDVAPPAAVAFDLVESSDARSIRAGKSLLRRLDQAVRR